MGIRFECVHCGHTLHVKDHLAGKRGICPHCQGKIDIPYSSSNLAPADEPSAIAVELKSAIDEQPTREMRPEDVANHRPTQIPMNVGAGVGVVPAGARGTAGGAGGDPIAEAPQLQWYVLPPGSMTKYGPAQGEMMRAWLEEGRVAADALVWREGWSQWRGAASVFPRLMQTAVPATPARPTATIPLDAGPVIAGAASAVPGTTSPAGAVPIVDESVVDEPVALPYSPAAGEAVVLGDDDLEPATKRTTKKHVPARKMRDQHTLIISTLVVLVVILLPLLVWVLLHQ